MAPPFDSPIFHLSRFGNITYLYQIPKDHPIPKVLLDALHDTTSKLISISRTAEEISVVTDVILEGEFAPEGLKVEEYACYTMTGPMPLGKKS